MKNEIINELDSLKMMREIREKLSEKYYNNPELQLAELKEINQKYNIDEKKILEKEEVLVA